MIPDADISLLEYPYESRFKLLRDQISWKQSNIVVYGKKVPQPRLTAWYGDAGASYSYSGVKNNPLPWVPILDEIRNNIYELLECRFNSVLLNLYRDGNDSIGFHSDNERELGKEPIIASLSFGASRTFIFKNKQNKYPDHEITLEDGSLLIMMGKTQDNWQHGIRKTKKPIGERINLTFRNINTI